MRTKYHFLRLSAYAIAALLTLHQPGNEVYVNGDEIMIVTPPTKGAAAPWAKTEVVVHDRSIFVLETPAEVKRLRDGE